MCHHFSITYYAGGEKTLLNLARALKYRGHKVSIYSIPLARREVNIADTLSVPYSEKWLQRIDDADVAYYVYAPLLHRMLETDAPRIAGLHSAIYSLEMQHEDVKKMNIVTFARYFGLLRTLTRLYFALRRGELNTYNAIHIVNPAMKDKAGHSQTYFIPNGIDLDRFTRLPVDPTQKRKKFTVLFPGRREWSKGLDMYLEIAMLLSKHDIETTVFGSSLANMKGLGFVQEEDLPRVYAETHLVVYPSRIDTMSVTILEALASGAPVITTPTASHTTFNLPVTYASNPAETAKRILEAKDEYENRPEEYLRRVTMGRTSVEEYDVRRVAQAFEKMFIDVIKNL